MSRLITADLADFKDYDVQLVDSHSTVNDNDAHLSIVVEYTVKAKYTDQVNSLSRLANLLDDEYPDKVCAFMDISSDSILKMLNDELDSRNESNLIITNWNEDPITLDDVNVKAYPEAGMILVYFVVNR